MLLSHYNAHAIEAGLDEAGRGCLAGPVVAGAVILPPDYQHPTLTDSKQVSRAQRDRLRLDIERDAIAWAVAEASATEIDKINILKASFLAMHRAVDALTIRPEHLLVDGNRFVPYPMLPHTCFVKGDARFLPIAAASILAKTHRDNLMDELDRQFPHYGWARNAGYPTRHHRDAIREHGPCIWHRMTFRLLSA
jgi:ribonuclease HII